jgi:hypothetical protein
MNAEWWFNFLWWRVVLCGAVVGFPILCATNPMAAAIFTFIGATALVIVALWSEGP